jgi:hypothetical protein
MKGEENLSRLFAEGEQVYAVQYRKVEFRWFSSGKVAEEAALKESAVWRSFWTRGAGTAIENEVDSVEVNVKHRLEKSDLGPETEAFEDDEEEILFEP